MKIGDEVFLRKGKEHGTAYMTNESLKHEYKVDLRELRDWFRGDKLFCTFTVVRKE